ncbi:MAG: hypothetical protein V2I56_09110, partial [Desulfobacteraceae bacterium]|nr:hypothetical protein [Desulfobacteraceae bacterium]
MNWFWFSIGAVGGLFFLGLKRQGKWKQWGKRPAAYGKQPFTEEDQVERALSSGNVDVMTTILGEVTDPLLRNALLERIVSEYYRRRTEP